MTNATGPGRMDVSAIPVPDQMRWALEYIVTAYDEKNIRERREELRDNLKQWIIDNCEPDENGNLIFEFDKPIQLGETEVYGLMAQRRVSEFIDEEQAYAIINKYNVYDQCVEPVTTEEINFDQLYALNQTGIITDEDIDSILDIRETFALVRMEG